MLPFLKKKQVGVNTGVIYKTRTPDNPDEQPQPDDKDAAIEACALDLIQAVHSRDAKAVAMAIRSAFEILESMPHYEAEHNEG